MSDNVETFSVYGGQGLRLLVMGLTFESAEAFARGFDLKCSRAGLMLPPTRILREQ